MKSPSSRPRKGKQIDFEPSNIGGSHQATYHRENPSLDIGEIKDLANSHLPVKQRLAYSLVSWFSNLVEPAILGSSIKNQDERPRGVNQIRVEVEVKGLKSDLRRQTLVSMYWHC